MLRCSQHRYWPLTMKPSPDRSRLGEKGRLLPSQPIPDPMPEIDQAMLPPGSTIGILGGGQLGRMLSLAASKLGFRTHIFCPDPESPAFQVTDRCSLAAYDDRAALAAFAQAVDIVTYEFENVPAETAALLLKHVPVEPKPSVLDITQDRYTEKSFIRQLRLSVAEFDAVSSIHEIEAAAHRIGYPCVLKTRKFGYDGKGQEIIRDRQDIAAAWSAIDRRPAIIEAFVPFSREISVIVARGGDGSLCSFDIAENRHEAHILRTSTVPAAVSEETALAAQHIGRTLAQAFRYIGVLAVEIFVLDRGPEQRLLVNEIAPRVHNSGHWTEDACHISQFELHIRAVAGWPLPVPFRHSNVEMTNLLGSEVFDYPQLAREPHSILHLYGKSDPRPGRKMGHVNRLMPLTPR
jgi:5-(carboxyamino)imidazole ribonucleotide synthase